MLVVLITPPPVDEEGRKEYAKYDLFLFSFCLEFSHAHRLHRGADACYWGFL